MSELNEDELLAALRTAMTDDVVPESALAEAELVPGINQLDAELAEFLEPAGATRGDEDSTVFSIDGVVVTVESVPDGIVVTVLGLDDISVELMTPNEQIAGEQIAGQFRIVTDHVGPARVVVRAGQRSIATEWFTLG